MPHSQRMWLTNGDNEANKKTLAAAAAAAAGGRGKPLSSSSLRPLPFSLSDTEAKEAATRRGAVVAQTKRTSLLEAERERERERERQRKCSLPRRLYPIMRIISPRNGNWAIGIGIVPAALPSLPTRSSGLRRRWRSSVRVYEVTRVPTRVCLCVKAIGRNANVFVLPSLEDRKDGSCASHSWCP